MSKKSFVLYVDYLAHIQLLDMEQRGRLLTAIFNFASGEPLPEMDGMTSMAFSFIQSQLQRDAEKYEDICKKRSEAGKQGGRPRKEESKAKQEKAKKAKGFSEKQIKAKKPDNDNDTDNDTDTENDNDTDNDIKLNIGGALKTAPPQQTDIIIDLRLNDGTFYSVTRDKFNEWVKLFPAVDVLSELRKMRAWCQENAAKRKTRRGIGAFIVRWLSREQDKPHTDSSRNFNTGNNHNWFLEQLQKGEGNDQSGNHEDFGNIESGLPGFLPGAERW